MQPSFGVLPLLHKALVWITLGLLPFRQQGAAWVLERTRHDFMPKQEITAGEDGKVTVVLGGKIKDVKHNDLTKE